MLSKTHSQTILLPHGEPIHIETGRLAGLAHGAALVTQGKTMLLATAVSEKQTHNMGFLPLSVDYQEKYAAAGKIPGGFFKREGKLTDHEILVSRLVDRAIRPLFPKNYFDNVQVRITLLSADTEVSPDPLAALAASTALTLAPIPFYDPISEVRVARIEGQLVINPGLTALDKADMDIIVAASHERVLMIEGEMQEVGEEDLLAAIQFGHEAIQKHCEAQQALARSVGVDKEAAVEAEEDPACLAHQKALYQAVHDVASQGFPSKAARKKALQQVYDNYCASLGTSEEDTEAVETMVKEAFKATKQQVTRDLILQQGRRIDGRRPEEIRDIAVEVGTLPSAHGSSLFTRGETQVLTSLTLGSKQDEQIIDGVVKSGYKKVMLHYEFPSFSTGEVKPNRGPSRREVGHGNLALRAIKAVLPSEQDNPYTMRYHPMVLSSNGSSSMATVCGASLASMDAGIKTTKTVAGIAMGLVSDPTAGQDVVLSDILGEEDQIGDMDFKVTGTRDGLTACQMDIKIGGLSYDLLRKALGQAKQGIHHIIDVMEKVIQAPRGELKAHVPRIETIKIPQTSIGAVIGPGGKVIQEMQRSTGATINVSEEDGMGIVYVLSPDQAALNKAIDAIEAITQGPKVDKIYTGKVKSLQKYGAFVEFIPGTDGLLHISQVSERRLTEEELRETLPVGKTIRVRLIEVKGGKYSLGLEAMDEVAEAEGTTEEDVTR